MTRQNEAESTDDSGRASREAFLGQNWASKDC